MAAEDIIIKLKRGVSGGAQPSGLTHGELAINTTDVRLYVGSLTGSTVAVNNRFFSGAATPAYPIEGDRWHNGSFESVYLSGYWLPTSGTTGTFNPANLLLFAAGASGTGGITFSGNVTITNTLGGSTNILNGLTVQGGITGTLLTTQQQNVTLLGTLSSLTASGLVSANAGLSASSIFVSNGATFNGNISAPNIVNSVNDITGQASITSGSNIIITQSGKQITIAAAATPAVVATSSVTGVASFRAADFDVSATGSVSLTGNVARTHIGQTFTGLQVFSSGLSANGLTGTILTPAQTNITAVGTLTSLNSAGLTSTQRVTISSGGLSVAGNIDGTIGTAAQPNITSLGTLTSLNSAGLTSTQRVNVSAGGIVVQAGGLSVTGGANLTGGSIFFGDIEVYDGAFIRTGGLSVTGGIAGTLLTAAQTNITSVGVLSGLSVNNGLSVTGGISATGGVNIGGGGISVTGGIAGTLVTPAQTNITSVGTLTSLNSTGLITTTSGLSANNINIASGATFGGAVRIFGDLLVSGGITTTISENVLIEDNFIILNSNATVADSGGIEVYRGSGNTNRVIRWNESSSAWQFTNDGTNYLNIGAVGSLPIATASTTGVAFFPHTDFSVTSLGGVSLTGNVARTHIGQTFTGLQVFSSGLSANGLTGTLNTAAQPNITSVGTLTSLTTAGLTSTQRVNVSFGGIVVQAGGLSVTGGSNLTGGVQIFGNMIANAGITSYGGVSTPRIFFGNTGANSISVLYDVDTYDTLSFEGSAGQLFSVYNNLSTGTIFSVNDISGIPSIEVDANGTVLLASFTGNVGIGISSASGTERVHIGGPMRVIGSVNSSGLSVTGSAVITGSADIFGGLFVDSGGLSVTGGIAGTLVTPAQPNITSVGTLTSLTTAGLTSTQRVNVSSGGIVVQAGGLSVTGGISATGGANFYGLVGINASGGVAQDNLMVQGNYGLYGISQHVGGTSQYFNIRSSHSFGNVVGYHRYDIWPWGSHFTTWVGRPYGGSDTQNAYTSSVVDDTTGYPNQNTHTTFNVRDFGARSDAVIYIGSGSSGGNTRPSLYAEQGAVLAASGGNVGIGTNSPSAKLDINGTFRASGLATLSGGLTANNLFVSQGTTFASGIVITRGGSEFGTVRLDTSNNLLYNSWNGHIFQNGSVERLRIDPASGFVGIGTNSPTQAIDVSGNAAVRGSLFVGNGVSVTGGITGTINTAAQPNITSVGVLNGLSVNNGLSVTGGISVTGNAVVFRKLFVNTANTGTTDDRAVAVFRSGTTGNIVLFHGGAGITAGIAFGVRGGAGALELTNLDTSGNQASRFSIGSGSDNTNILIFSGARGSEFQIASFVGASRSVGIGQGPANVAATLDVSGNALIRNGLSVTGGINATGGATFGGNLNVQENKIIKPNLQTYIEPNVGVSGSAGVLTCDLSMSQIFQHTLTGAITTINVLNVPTTPNTSIGFTLIIKQSPAGGYPVTFTGISGATALFPGGSSPVMTSAANKTDIVSYITYDNGSNWYGFGGEQGY